jgi:uncharacterized Zn-binding protein involved in type VI secretion
MPKAVVLGATLQCTCGSAPAKLIVNSQTQFTIDNKPAATVMDFKPGANIPPFGVCSVLTAAASGTPTPCALAPAGPWLPGSTAQVKFGDLPALLSTDKLQCAIPGVISIVDPGQKKTDDA